MAEPRLEDNKIHSLIEEKRKNVVALNVVIEKDQRDYVFVASGFLVSPDLVITSHHILEKEMKGIWVFWDQQVPQSPILAIVEKKYPQYDLALLRLAKKVPYPPLLLAAPGEVQLGEKIAIFGFPEATQSSNVTQKNLHLFQGNIASIQPQTKDSLARLVLDARVLQGNSGGPVISLKSNRVLGVISEIIVDSEEEKKKNPYSQEQIFSVEGESVGIAVPTKYIYHLLPEDFWK